MKGGSFISDTSAKIGRKCLCCSTVTPHSFKQVVPQLCLIVQFFKFILQLFNRFNGFFILHIAPCNKCGETMVVGVFMHFIRHQRCLLVHPTSYSILRLPLFGSLITGWEEDDR